DAAICGAHQVGIEALGPSDKEWLSHASGENAPRGLCTLGRKSVAGRHTRKSQRKALQRHRIGRDRATIRATRTDAMRSTRDALHRITHHLLRLVLRADIAAIVDSEMLAGADKSGVLARAVVVQRARLATAARQLQRRTLLHRPVRAAFQCRVVETGCL